MATAKKELSVEERLEALYTLQSIDSQIDRIQILKGELPMEVQDLEDEIEGLKKRVGNISKDIEAVNDEIAVRTKAKEEAKMLIQKYEKQQANVKNNREYDALSKEIELQNLEIQLCDKKIKDFKEKIEQHKKYEGESENILKHKESHLKEKKKELDKIVEETDNELKDLRKSSEKAQKEVDERLLTAYQRIRSTYRNGLAVVTIDRDSCGGCYATMPPQKQAEIKQRKKVIVCEHCGRIMAYPKDKEKSDVLAKEEAAAAPKVSRSRSRRAKTEEVES